jgi:chromosome segregation ATPase
LNTTPQPPAPAQGEAGIAPGAAPAPKPAVNPNLSANLSADYEALQNDMEQARELAADFQRQLAGKSNEFAQLKQLFDKATTDLTNLQAGIVELRQERHRLANESMRATAFQMKLGQVTAERDRLRMELEQLRKALEHSAEEMAAALRDRDAQIASLVIELVQTKEAVEAARREVQAARTATNARPGCATDRAVDSTVSSSGGRKQEKIELGAEFIDISFSA